MTHFTNRRFSATKSSGDDYNSVETSPFNPPSKGEQLRQYSPFEGGKGDVFHSEGWCVIECSKSCAQVCLLRIDGEEKGYAASSG